VGNRLSQTSSLHNIPTVGFTYGTDDTLLGETCDGNGTVTATGGKTFSYDSQNNLAPMNGSAPPDPGNARGAFALATTCRHF
jgi:hypothetical protein